MRKLILICVLLIPSISFGANWINVDKSDGSDYQLDISSIKKLPNNKRLVWHRGVTKVENGKTVYITLRAEIDCARETLQNNESYIDINDTKFLQTHFDNPKPFTPPPGSGGQKLIYATCKAP